MLTTRSTSGAHSPSDSAHSASKGSVDLASGKTESPKGSPDLSEQLRALQFNKPAEVANTNATAWRRLLLVLVAIGLGVVANSQFGRGVILGTPPPRVLASTIESDLSSAIVLDTSGFVLAETQVQIDPRAPGVLVELPISEGDFVEKGDLLGRIDDADLSIDVASAEAGVALAKARLAELKAGAREAEVEQARAGLEQTRARAALAKTEFDRAEKIKETISAKEYETTRTTYLEAKAIVRQNEQRVALLEQGARPEAVRAAEAEVKRAESVLSKAELWIEKTRIVSPLAGVVVDLKPRVGETIRPEAISGGFCVIADLSQLEIDVEVPERDLMRIKVNQPCRIEPEAYPNRFYAGHVSRVLPVANRQRGVVQFRVQVDEPDRELLPNMNCRVVVLSEGSPVDPDDSLYIPEEAIQRGEEGDYLFVLDGNQARIRPVTLGGKTDRGVTIGQGLFPGETVLLPEEPLRDGQEVKAFQEQEDASPEDTQDAA